MSDAAFDHLYRSQCALRASSYVDAGVEARAGLLLISTQEKSDLCLRAGLLEALGQVERDCGRPGRALRLYWRAKALAEACGADQLAANCAVASVIAARIAAGQTPLTGRYARLKSAARFVDLAAAPVYRSGDPVVYAEFVNVTASLYASCGNLTLARSYIRANVLPAGKKLDDPALLLSYILGEIRVLLTQCAGKNAHLIERQLAAADRLRDDRVTQPVRLMEHAVTWGLAYLAFGEVDQAERSLESARTILDRWSFANIEYEHASRLLEAAS